MAGVLSLIFFQWLQTQGQVIQFNSPFTLGSLWFAQYYTCFYLLCFLKGAQIATPFYLVTQKAWKQLVRSTHHLRKYCCTPLC